MHNFSLKILFTIMFIVGFGLTVFGDVVPNETDTTPDKVRPKDHETMINSSVGVCNGVNVRIRSMPSTKSAIISSNTKRGDKYEVLGTQGIWYKIRLPEFVTLWISAKYVQADQGKNGVLIGDNVRIRTSDSTNSTVVGEVNKGDIVEIIAKKGDWFMIIPPKQAIGWIHGDFFQKIGSYSNNVTAMHEERNKFLKRAAAYYASKGESKIAEAYRLMIREIVTPPPPTVDKDEEARKLEKAQYEAYLLRYNQANTEPETADVDALKALAQEILTFANGCTSEVKESVLALYNELNTKIQAAVAYQKKMEEDDKLKKEAERRRKLREEMLREVNIRLMRKDADKYVAKGVVVDKQLSSGVTIYFLAIGGVEKYRLVTINQDNNIRDFWRREIGIVGKIVYDEDEQYPVILCEELDILDKE